jgi:hypothetical protein
MMLLHTTIICMETNGDAKNVGKWVGEGSL